MPKTGRSIITLKFGGRPTKTSEGLSMFSMKKMIGALGIILLSTIANAQSDPLAHGDVFPMHAMAEGVWIEKLVGDMSVPGQEFVIRIHHDPGYVVLPDRKSVV